MSYLDGLLSQGRVIAALEWGTGAHAIQVVDVTYIGGSPYQVAFINSHCDDPGDVTWWSASDFQDAWYYYAVVS